MALVENLAFSLREQGRGVHALLWDDLGDLIRVLLVTHAALGDIPLEPLLVSGETTRVAELRDLIQTRLADQIQQERLEDRADDPDPLPHPLWILFVNQAASKPAGPQLNGWRRPLSEPTGTLLIVRNADFRDFQRYAPDLASFIGPRIYDTSRLMMVCSRDTLVRLKKDLPRPFESILRQLPGTLPTAEELADWTPSSSSDEG
jgi:hypothetical protein